MYVQQMFVHLVVLYLYCPTSPSTVLSGTYKYAEKSVPTAHRSNKKRTKEKWVAERSELSRLAAGGMNKNRRKMQRNEKKPVRWISFSRRRPISSEPR